MENGAQEAIRLLAELSPRQVQRFLSDVEKAQQRGVLPPFLGHMKGEHK